jgi:hypothetical protein
MNNYTGKKVIVRCDRAGVFYATLKEFDPTTLVADLEQVRRIHYWDGAASLSQLATEGVKNPSACRFTVTVAEQTVTQVIEIIPCTEEAIKNIEAVRVWKR